jgi:hypothetical protein
MLEVDRLQQETCTTCSSELHAHRYLCFFKFGKGEQQPSAITGSYMTAAPPVLQTATSCPLYQLLGVLRLGLLEVPSFPVACRFLNLLDADAEAYSGYGVNTDHVFVVMYSSSQSFFRRAWHPFKRLNRLRCGACQKP